MTHILPIYVIHVIHYVSYKIYNAHINRTKKMFTCRESIRMSTIMLSSKQPPTPSGPEQQRLISVLRTILQSGEVFALHPPTLGAG